MLISRLLKSIGSEFKTEDKDVKYITDNSEKCVPVSIFVCHDSDMTHVSSAIEKGAVLIIAKEKLTENCVVVSDTRKAYSLLCAEFFSQSHKKLRLIGVTGTNGKTTVSSMIYHLLTVNGRKCALMGTAGYLRCNEEETALLTTPDPFEMHRMFYEMSECNTEFCIMEASSQGLFQERLYNLQFETVIFTNLTADHLDYHGDMENYRKAKEKLFSMSENAIINLDDENAQSFIDASSGEITTYSLKRNEADFTAKNIKFSEGITDYIVVGNELIHRIRLNCPGNYNVYNSMAALICAIKCGLSLEESAGAMKSFYGVKGRFEFVPTEKDFRVVIDYAHTPDSLRQVLLTLSSFSKNRLITLFGCGGDRDKSKRGEMGEIATFYSDMVIITSDNPRHEKPMDIIDDILVGTEKSKTPVYIIENRRKAIEYALQKAQKNDIILLAGKGHETYQIIGDEKIVTKEKSLPKSSDNGVNLKGMF